MHMPYCCLKPGMYNVKVIMREGTYSFDAVESFRFIVKATKMTNQSLFYQPRMWKVKQNYCLTPDNRKKPENSGIQI